MQLKIAAVLSTAGSQLAATVSPHGGGCQPVQGTSAGGASGITRASYSRRQSRNAACASAKAGGQQPDLRVTPTQRNPSRKTGPDGIRRT